MLHEFGLKLTDIILSSLGIDPQFGCHFQVALTVKFHRQFFIESQFDSFQPIVIHVVIYRYGMFLQRGDDALPVDDSFTAGASEHAY